MPLYHSASYAPLSQSRSRSTLPGLQHSSSGMLGSRSRLSGLRRSASYANGMGHGGPYTAFGRSNNAGSAPHYMDRYPYVRYTPVDTWSPSLSMIREDGYMQSRAHYAQKERQSKQYLEGKWSLYSSSLATQPHTGPRMTPMRMAGSVRADRDLNVEDAVRLYKNRCMTVSALSKYWLSPPMSNTYNANAWSQRRSYEKNLRSSVAHGDWSYPSRYTSRY